MEPKLPLEKELESIFLGKFPAFPDNVKEIFVQWGPYVLLVLSIFSVVGLLAAFGIGGAALGIGAAAYGGGYQFFVGIAVAAISTILNLMAFSPLKNRKKAGWNLLYYSALLNFVGNLLMLNILGAVIGGVIGFWILFQIRDKYAV